MYGCESWMVKKAERWRIDAFELWCWRRLLRVPWTPRRSNQSILKEISPEYSLEGLMLKLQYFGHLIRRTDSLEKTQGALAADTLVGHKVGWRGSSQSQVWARASPRLHGSWHPKGGGAGVQGAGVRALNELGFSPPQWWSQPWLGVGPKPKVLEPQISATSAFPQDNVGLCLVWGQSQGPRG